MSYLTYHDDVVGDIRVAEKSDCIKIGENLREQDALELYNYDRSSPVEACLNSFSKSTIAMTVEHDNIPIAMFGIMVIDDVPTLWMLTTDGLKSIGRNFVRNTRDWINKMLEIYPVLTAYCDCRNKESERWLEYSGGMFGGVFEMGMDKMPFYKYTFRRMSCKI